MRRSAIAIVTGFLALLAGNALAEEAGRAVDGIVMQPEAPGVPADQELQEPVAAPAMVPPPTPQMRAQNGVIVPLPEIENLDCASMRSVLGVLDRSNYRGVAPLPPDHPDRPIFDYENQLAAEAYDRCLTEGAVLRDSSEAFQHGFDE